MATHDREIAECYRRIALGKTLNNLLNSNPEFRTVVVDGFLRDEVLKQSLNINDNESGTIQFLKGVAVFNKYLDKIRIEAEQAQLDLNNYQQMLQDTH